MNTFKWFLGIAFILTCVWVWVTAGAVLSLVAFTVELVIAALVLTGAATAMFGKNE